MSLSKAFEKLGTTYSMRCPNSDDFQSILALIHVCEISLVGMAETTEHDLRVYFSTPGFNLATDSWLIFSVTGQLVGFAWIEAVEHARMFARVFVHPEHLGQGIGTYLLQLLEQWAQQQIVLAAPDLRISLLATGLKQNSAAQNLLESNDFKIVRSFLRMGIDLASVPAVPQWPEGIVIRTVTSDLLYAVYEADESMFQDHWGYIPGTFDEWMHEYAQDENFDASLWFLAMAGEEIVGLALCDDGKELGGWVRTLGVSRAWRRKGLASALLQYAFHEFSLRAISQVFLSVDAQSLTGATRLYERAGMHVVRERIYYEKELRAGKELSTQTLQGE